MGEPMRLGEILETVELDLLRKNLARYREVLLGAGLRVAKEKGLETRIVPEDSLRLTAEDIVNIPASGEYCDTRKIIELGGERRPKVYKTYRELEEKYIGVLKRIQSRG